MKIIQDLIDKSRYNIKCPFLMDAINITTHNSANDASAKNEIRYMKNNDNEVSFHIAVDDKEARQGIPFNRNSWHAGDGVNGTGNRKSISIEICYSKSGGERYAKAEENAVQLIAQLLKERGWGIDRVKKHQDWNGKNCPHRILDEGRWESFLQRIQNVMGQTSQTTSSSKVCDQILRVGSVVQINKILTVTGVDSKNNLIAIQELTGKPTANYHWFDPTNFEVVEGPKKSRQICTVGCKVRLKGNYKVLGLVKTEDWACKLKIGNRTNWVWTNPCYEVQD